MSVRATLRLLLVEDTDDDAALIVRAVRQAGFDIVWHRVQTAEEFRNALDDPPDFIISDHALPSFSSLAALQLLQARGIDVPFLVVSGTIDEETAVTILRAGAHDFVTKQNLARLGPAIQRELQEAHNRAERRKAQQDLRIQRDFLRLVIDADPGLIFTKRPDGVFTLANQAVADLYGVTVDELVGRTHQMVDRSGNSGGFLTAEREVLASGQARVADAEPVTDARTGGPRWFETRVLPLVAPDGTPQVLGIGTEITQRRVAEEALRVTEEQFRQAQKMEAVGQLAGGIAHDFNNLLTAILGYSYLLKDRVQSDPEMLADLEEIQRAGERAESLTRQLLAFGRKQMLDPQILDLHEVVRGLEKLVRRATGEMIQLEISTASPLERVRADRSQIEQVLLNLAINARDAMPGGGTLGIHTSSDAPPPGALNPAAAAAPAAGGWVSLTVTDTGSGMPPDVSRRIFEPFFTTKGPGKGTGLGLAMVYGVVAQSGGTITVDSEVGRGTRFSIYLPAAAGQEAPRAAAPQVAVELRGTETILLVEDEVAIRELVRKVLGSYGYNVLEAADPDDAIGIARRHAGPVHLLLSDIAMPRMSGPDLAQRLVPMRPEMRVLYMSGFGGRLSLGLGTVSPAVSVLLKPFTPGRLAARVRECLSREMAGRA
jgi:PAS domain S-box-containing protein